MDEIKVVSGVKGIDGTWRANQISKDHLPGDMTSWPALERVTEVLGSQGWQVADQHEDGDKVTVTLKRNVPNENDELYRALGYDAAPVTANPDQIAAVTADLRNMLRYSS